MTDQDKLTEKIRGAFNNACLSGAFNEERYGSPTRDSLLQLRELRFSKSTWVGHDENNLRFECDRMLSEYDIKEQS